ncbi:hypothetical protein [Burkholderia stagnalis]|uniref:hypothetical protein n=1 Tax=Burkholderia stagnalis TaxID=1503054 RepID=UPI000AF09D90|nr:hypothetical protein [Burkholderia stagnalis]
MSEELKSVARVAFESAMQRCAQEAGAEPRFDRDVDGNYLQPEMRRALAGWLGAASLIQDHIRGIVEFGVVRSRGNAAFQSGFLQFLEHALNLLDLSSGAPDSSRAADLPQANAVTDAAAFDDALPDGSNRALKAKIAIGGAQGRGDWWSAPVAPAPVPVAEIVAAGELTKISSSPVMGGQLDITTSAGPIGITGFPNELVRDCKPLLWEQVEIVIRSKNAGSAALATPGIASTDAASLEWLAASLAAFQARVDLDTVRAWATANEIEHREDNGTLMVRCASVLARAHRYWTEQRPVARASGADGTLAGDGVRAECEMLAQRATAVVSEHKT